MNLTLSPQFQPVINRYFEAMSRIKGVLAVRVLHGEEEDEYNVVTFFNGTPLARNAIYATELDIIRTCPEESPYLDFSVVTVQQPINSLSELKEYLKHTHTLYLEEHIFLTP